MKETTLSIDNDGVAVCYVTLNTMNIKPTEEVLCINPCKIIAFRHFEGVGVDKIN